MLSGNNEEYIDLVFERIDDASVLSNFYCGIPDMDDFIHEKLQGYLNRTGCEAYVIRQKDEIVAMLSLGDDTLNLDDDDKDDMRSGYIPKPTIALEDQSFLAEKEFPAVEITYLAVEKGRRGQGIGPERLRLSPRRAGEARRLVLGETRQSGLGLVERLEPPRSGFPRRHQ